MTFVVTPRAFTPFHGAMVRENHLREFKKICALPAGARCPHAGKELQGFYECMECDHGSRGFEIVRRRKLRDMERRHREYGQGLKVGGRT